MSYFTRFHINMTRRETRSMLSSPYRLHAAIAGSFPSSGAESAGDERALWRIDRRQDGSAVLYIVSPTKPSLVGLDEQIGFPDLDDPQWVTRDYDPFLRQIAEGQRYTFRLVANPVVKRRLEQDGVEKRISHLTMLQQAAWLAGKDAYLGTEAEVPELFYRQDESRAQRNGFAICNEGPDGALSLIVSDSRKRDFRRKEGERPVTVATARYDGILEVTDADKLRHALTHGIGHAKAFGCGLLTLVPQGPRQ